MTPGFDPASQKKKRREGIGGETKRREGKVQKGREREEMGGEDRAGAVTQWWYIYLACKRGSESISSNEAREKGKNRTV